jgi:group I intron endonuclease
MISCNASQTLPETFNCQGIYGIKNSVTSKIYIGSSFNIKVRIQQHLNLLTSNNHHSQYLQNSFNKRRVNSFDIVLIEEVQDRESLVEREQYWIDHYNSYSNGYNARPNAESFHGMVWSKEQNLARKNSNKKTWKSKTLRQKLSKRFSGRRRGVWSKDSFKKLTLTLKKRHSENPEWHKKMMEMQRLPENEEKRIEGIRKSLQNPQIRKARVKQLSEASNDPKRLANLRLTYFEKYNRKDIDVNTPEEFEQLCKKLYDDGSSLRDIGKKLNIDHKAVASRLRRLGVEIKKRPKKGSQLKCSKLNESDVKQIKIDLAKGVKQVEIAKRYSVSSSVISEISTGKAWSHVK